MTQQISLTEATELIKPAATPLEKEIISQLKFFDSYERKIICYNGNIELPELKVGEAVVIVNGNLHVTGNISDCYDEDETLLIVLGNVTCKNLLTFSTICITGDLRVDHTLLGESACDYTCRIGGNLQAGTILAHGHWIKVEGEATFQYFYYRHIPTEDKNGELARNLGDGELMDDIENNPDVYQGRSYVPMIEEVQKYGMLDAEKAIQFIMNGHEWFCER